MDNSSYYSDTHKFKAYIIRLIIIVTLKRNLFKMNKKRNTEDVNLRTSILFFMNDALNASWQYRKLSCFRCCEYLINYFTFIEVEQRSDDDIHYIKECLPVLPIFRGYKDYWWKLGMRKTSMFPFAIWYFDILSSFSWLLL